MVTPCVSCTALVCVDYLILAFLTIGGDAVAIKGIVVVQRTVCVHNADIVRVPGVGRTEPRVTRKLATTL